MVLLRSIMERPEGLSQHSHRQCDSKVIPDRTILLACESMPFRLTQIIWKMLTKSTFYLVTAVGLTFRFSRLPVSAIVRVAG